MSDITALQLRHMTRIARTLVALLVALTSARAHAQLKLLGDGGPGPIKAQHLTAELVSLSPSASSSAINFCKSTRVMRSEPSSKASTSLGLASLTAAEAYTYVIANAGASPRDQVDAYVVSTVESLGTSGAIITNQASTGLSNDGYGTL